MINNRPLMNYIMKNGEFINCSDMAHEFGMSRMSINCFYRNERKVSDTFIVAAMRYLGTPIAVIDELLAEKYEEVEIARMKPHHLLDHLKITNGLENDNQLAEKLKMSRGDLSRIRSGKLIVGKSAILKIHEAFNMPTSEIRKLLGENK